MKIHQDIITGVETKNFSMGRLLDIIAREYPNVEAAVFPDLRKTWKQFKEDVDRLAIGLIKLGIRKGDIVAVWAQNVYEWILAWFALPKTGAILVPLDHWNKPDESKYILKHSEAIGIICTSNYEKSIEIISPDLSNLKYIISIDDSNKEKINSVKVLNLNDMLEAEPTDDERKSLKERQDAEHKDDVMLILYTSGTTGFPKGAMLTHYNIIKNTLSTARVMDCTSEDKYMIPVPFSHCFGCILGVTCATLTGSTMLPLKDQNPKVALKTVNDEKASVMHGTPTHFIRYIQEYESNMSLDLSSLRTGIIAGCPCPPDTLEGIINVLKMPDIIIGYGLTEASPICTLTKKDDDFEYRIHSVGQPIPDIEIKIVNDDNEEVPIGTKGELVVRGYNVMKGYYKQPEITKIAIDEKNFLHSGDLATIDENNYVKIVGRKKDMIIYGGFNVYPKIVEDYLLKNPNIMEAAVVGIPDKEYGEVVGVAAVVKPGFSEQDLVDYCYGQISSPSVPRFVNYDVDIPLSGRGKVQKYKLRDTFAAMLKEGKLGPKMIPTKVLEKKKKQ